MKIREVLTDESKWCKGTFARNAEGRPEMPSSDEACKWCFAGAVWFCRGSLGSLTDFWESSLDGIQALFGEEYQTVGDWNDDPKTTFEDVCRLADYLKV